jgi:actin-related protein
MSISEDILLICNVQDYSGLYNNVVHTVICEGILLICNVEDYSGLYNNVVHTVNYI